MSQCPVTESVTRYSDIQIIYHKINNQSLSWYVTCFQNCYGAHRITFPSDSAYNLHRTSQNISETPQNSMVVGAYNSAHLSESSLVGGMLSEFLLSSQNHFYFSR